MTPVPLARWAPAATPAVNLAIAKRSLCDVGICEIPPGSNRSGVIDQYNRDAGIPEETIQRGAAYWCASAVAAWWREAGAQTPGKWKDPSCDEWMRWGKATGRWSVHPVIGAAVLYGVPGDAQHIGVIVRVDPLLLSVEGNTSLAGFSRNGVAVVMKAVATTRLLGYVHPEAA